MPWQEARMRGRDAAERSGRRLSTALSGISAKRCAFARTDAGLGAANLETLVGERK